MCRVQRQQVSSRGAKANRPSDSLNLQNVKNRLSVLQPIILKSSRLSTLQGSIHWNGLRLWELNIKHFTMLWRPLHGKQLVKWASSWRITLSYTGIPDRITPKYSFTTPCCAKNGFTYVVRTDLHCTDGNMYHRNILLQHAQRVLLYYVLDRHCISLYVPV